MPGAGAEDHDAALLEVPDRAPRDVRLGDLAHRDRGLDPGLDALLLQEVLERQAVHHDAEHAHVVGAGPVHAALLELGAAEEVAAAGDDRDLDAGALHGGDLAGDLLHDVGVDADPAAAEHLAGQLEQDAVVAGHDIPSVARALGVHRPKAGPMLLCALIDRPPPCTSGDNLIDLGGSGADLEAGEPLHLDTGRVENGLDRLLGVGHRRLVEQDDVLEEAVEAPLGDLGDRLLGLALLAGGGLGDLALLLHDVGRDLVAGEVRRLHRGDLHRGTAGGLLVGAVVLDEHADGGRQVGGTPVHVGHDRAVEDGNAAELDLLADADRELLDDLADGLVADRDGLERLGVGRLGLGGGVRDLLGGGDEVVVLGDEVGLAVQLDERAAGGRDQAGGRGALGTALRGLLAAA